MPLWGKAFALGPNYNIGMIRSSEMALDTISKR